MPVLRSSLICCSQTCGDWTQMIRLTVVSCCLVIVRTHVYQQRRHRNVDGVVRMPGLPKVITRSFSGRFQGCVVQTDLLVLAEIINCDGA